MPRPLRPLRLLLAVAQLWRSARALTVGVTPVHRLHAKPSPHESLRQHWTVSKTAPDDAVQALRIDALCHVRLSYAAHDTPDLLATVLVSGSDFKLITAADVVAAREPKTLEIRHQDAAGLQGVDGFVGIEVVLHHKQSLRELHTLGDGDVVVLPDVLLESDPLADVSIDASGAGVVYLPPQLAISAKTVSFSTNGSASLYLPTARALNVSEVVSFRQSGRGAIAATSAVLAATLTIAVASSGVGGVCIDSTFVETNAVKVHATSAGDVYVGGHDGSWDATHQYYCDVAQVYQSGAGSVDLGSIVCIDTDVELYGSGNVTVASARSLGGHAFGAGKILFAGDSPVDVLDVDPWAYLKQPIAHQAEAYQPRTCTVAATPPWTLSRIGGDHDAGFLGRHVLTPARVGVVALLALCIGAAYLAETRRQRDVRSHTHRGERTPLLGGRDGDAS